MFDDRFIFAWGGKGQSTSEATALVFGLLMLLQEADQHLKGQQVANARIASAKTIDNSGNDSNKEFSIGFRVVSGNAALSWLRALAK